ncbi:MAG: dephospho-CoA kinase [Desulfuromonas sp.]|nr:dephospho-CoA kinase [Desulfuromonas sp.]
MVLGVTGGIASGKSTVVAMLQRLGAQIVSADQLSRELVEPGSSALSALMKRFGEQILHADGTLNRQQLGTIVFADEEARHDLEAILHPAIAELSQQRLRQAAEQVGQDGLVVYEAPLLYEAGAEGRVDKVLSIVVDDQVQLRRLMGRDNSDADVAQQRIDAQMPQGEKARRADYIIDNSAGLEQLQRQVEELYGQLLAGGR